MKKSRDAACCVRSEQNITEEIKMQLKEIFAKETSRTEEVHYRTIYLVPEGTFYRAYEWSAWLCHRCVSQFKPTHRLLKNSDESVVFVGFPQTSLDRYTPEGATISVGEDKVVEMVLADDLLVCDMTIEDLKQDFENWKSCVPLTESSKRRLQEEKQLQKKEVAPMRMTDVMHRIISYPIEQHSPLETMAFLAEIKQQLLEII